VIVATPVTRNGDAGEEVLALLRLGNEAFDCIEE